MKKNTPKGILVVSFGTSINETRRLTIDAIENTIAGAYPDCRIYRAWTSQMICSKLLKRDHIKIDSVAEAMARIKKDGVRDVIIQPTHVVNGIENDRMIAGALEFTAEFDSIRFGAPLLSGSQDADEVINAVAEEFPALSKGEMLALMGHGTAHFANSIYAALDIRFKERGYSNIFLGTVNDALSIQQLLRIAELKKPEKILLAPFMIVAGDHALKDMAGDGGGSWRSCFEAAGYPVECVMKGLGQYPGVREIFVRHAAAAMGRDAAI